MKKNRIIGIAVALMVLAFGALLLVGAGVGAWYWWTVRSGSVEAVATRLPTDTSALIVMRGFPDIAAEFRELRQGATQTPPDRNEVEFRAKFRDAAGFEIDDPKGWASTGIDFTRPWAGAMSAAADPDDAEFYLFMPVLDGDKASAFLNRVLLSQGAPVSPATFGAHAGSVIEQRAAFAEEDGYMVAVSSPRRGFDAASALRVFFERDRSNPLWKRAAFKDVLAASTEDWHLFGYFSPELVARGWAASDREARDLFGTLGAGGAGYAARLTNMALDSRVVLLQTSDTPSVLQSGPDPLANKVSGDALAVTRLGFDYKKLWAMAKEDPNTAAELDDATRTIRDQWGVDLSADIIENLNGPISLVALNEGRMPGIAAWVAVKDPAKTTRALDAVSARLRDARMTVSTAALEGQSWYFIEHYGVGVVGNDLIVAAGEGRMDALRADLSGSGRGSFTARLPEKVQRDLRGGAPIYAYLDVGQALRLADNNPMASRMIDRDARAGARALSGVSMSLSSAGRQVLIESAWHAPPGGFAAALREIAAEQR